MFFLISHESWGFFNFAKGKNKGLWGYVWHLPHLRTMYPFVQFLKCHHFFWYSTISIWVTFTFDSQENLFGKQKQLQTLKMLGCLVNIIACISPWSQSGVRCDRENGNWFSGGISFNCPCARGKYGTSYFLSFCGCRESGRVGSASFLTHPVHSLCDPSLTRAVCLWEIGCMITPPLGCRVTCMSPWKTKLCATAGTRKTHFHFMLESWGRTDLLKQVVTRF